ncbi:MAG: tripartite tricarboxylate transporter permease [Sphingomonadales bacterium]|nr:tripartite tricarboxylate transporter permease [Sphingomonadales bacterium]
MAQLLTAFSEIMAFWPMFYVVLGVVLGLTVGAIPGLGAAMLIALLLPLTFYMDSVLALIFLVSIYVGSVSGGLISATLMKMPGTPSAIMTTLDGFPMAMQGKAGRALSFGIFSSFIGGSVSWIFLAVLAPPLAWFALKFGPYEYFALVLMALFLISSVSQGAMLRGLIAAAIGFAVSLVGPDLSSGTIRLTFGADQLKSGFRLLPTLLGVFVISQIIVDMADTSLPVQQATAKFKDMFLKRADFAKHWWNFLRSSLIGTWIGILPGVGSAVAAIVSYTIARNFSKTPEIFGKGAEEGIIAAESANNASVNGALIPLIALGIPGSVVDAILIGALMIHNLQPGPGLFVNQPEIAYGVIAAALVANVVMFIVMLGFSGHIAKLCAIPKSFILPAVVFFCIVGVYTTSGRIFDIWIMFGFGFVGYLMHRSGLSIGAFVLGYILAPIAEGELRNGLMLYDNSLWPLFTRPISLGFLLMALVIFLWPTLARRFRNPQPRPSAHSSGQDDDNNKPKMR